ncbi:MULTISPECIES: GtrA family protein [unclassified Roseobacter]|uniref:GtrA family protein n=1 Tax=unclassified Roseobacter TaxID=196798 RepID=UPI0030EBD0CF
MTLQSLVLRYTLFAVLATLANLVTQRGVLWFGDSGTVFTFAVAAGTIVGLVLKYILDKRWIFGDMSVGVKAHSKRFSRYTVMGFVTTAIFWGMETAFWLVWKTDAMRELGAVLGLSMGYLVKYNLDRRFVFSDTELGNVT